MTLFDRMGYDEETKQILAIARCRTGLTNKSLVILHENTKVNNVEFLQRVNDYIVNVEFLQRVNDYIVNDCMSIQDANKYIQENNTMNIPELN